MILAAASTAPSPLWFTTRGAGTVTLIVLTASVALGIVTATGWRAPFWPRFLTAALHRNLSMLALFLLVIHLITATLDPFAHLRWRDAVVPAGAPYRPVWLGLGVLAMEVLVGVALTSLLRDRVGYGTWRTLHWMGYAAWPLAVVHGLGTGSDARAWWSVGITAGCVGAVVLAGAWRLAIGWPSHPAVRGALGGMAAVGLFALTSWAFAGPLEPGWSLRAGTPIAKPAAPAPINDSLHGTVVRNNGSVQMTLADLSKPDLVITVQSAHGGAATPTLTVTRGGKTVCTAPASAGIVVEAACGSVHVTVTVSGGPDVLDGKLVTTGPLS